MINNKGDNFASDYWSHNVYQQAKNAITSPDKNPYGVKGDENWEYIALSEGWANYRQWKMSKQYLKYNPITKTVYGDDLYSKNPYYRVDEIEYRYAALFNELKSIVSDEIFEKAISSCETISELKRFLLSERSNYATTIKNKFDKYGKFN